MRDARSCSLIPLGLVFLGLVACSEDTTRPPAPAIPASIDLASDRLGLYPGETRDLTPDVRDAAGETIADADVTWSSSEPDIAAITSAGVLTTSSPGTAIITATAGDASVSITVRVTRFVAVSLPCALDSEGRIFCWGETFDAPVWEAASTDSAPALLSTNIRFTAFSTGAAHGCGVGTDGAAFCWGSNREHQLGTGSDPLSEASVSAVSGGHALLSVDAGADHTCAVDRNGDGFCWGYGPHGQLGNNDRTVAYTPDAVVSDMAWQRIVAGAYSTCGLTTAGAAYCWGFIAQDSVPARVEEVPPLESIDVEMRHACGVGGGELHCWRYDAAPARIGQAVTWAQVSVGDNHLDEHSCALSTDGTAYCWGSNQSGQLGDGTTSDSAEPVRVQGDLRFTAVSVGSRWTCALTLEGAVYCWGEPGPAAPLPASNEPVQLTAPQPASP